MKKILSLAACASALLAFGDAVESDVIATVGVTKINSGLQNTILAVSYGDLESGSIKIESLVKTTNLKADDELRVYSGNSYSSWTLDENGGKWVAPATFSKDANGDDSSGLGADAKTTVPVGVGIWLMRKSGDWENTPFYIYGAPITTKTVDLKAGWNLIGNPTQTEADLSKLEAVVGDRILDSSRKEYTLDSEGWYYTETSTTTTTIRGEERTVVKTTKIHETPAIDAGLGFWYYAQTARTINW